MKEQEYILSLSKIRYEFIDKQNKSWNETTEDYMYNPEEIDELAGKILRNILEYRDKLSFEFIFEELTNIGWAPCLLYDDNGNFAISGDGMQSISLEPEDTEMYLFVKKEAWKSSIREALNYYLDKDDEENNKE